MFARPPRNVADILPGGHQLVWIGVGSGPGGAAADRLPLGYGDRMPWLVKTEPNTYSIADLARDRRTRWDSIRNYQSRNTMRDLMKVGDPVLIYHSNAEPPGLVGLAKVSAPAIGDVVALDPKSDYYDPKSTRENPIWLAIEIAFVEQFKRLVPLDEIRATKGLEKLPLLARGQRLSVQPVSDAEFAILCGLAERPATAATKAGGAAKPKAKAAPKARAKPSAKRTP